MTPGIYNNVQINADGKVISVGNQNYIVNKQGVLYYNDLPGTTIAIVTASDGTTNLVTINPTTTFEDVEEFEDGSTGKLTYIGQETKQFQIHITMSMSSVAINESFVFYVVINGTVDTKSRVVHTFLGLDYHIITFGTTKELAPEDYIQVKVGNMTSVNDIKVHTYLLSVHG